LVVAAVLEVVWLSLSLSQTALIPMEPPVGMAAFLERKLEHRL
jgi:hypothetical protein